jgi:hypothetical protein
MEVGGKCDQKNENFVENLIKIKFNERLEGFLCAPL